MFTGLAQLRVANAEPCVFARWAGLFARQRRTTLRARRWAAAQLAFNSLFTPLASAVLLAVIWLFLVTGEESSIYRLLFRFERPDSGAVLFDGHDLLNLDPEAVRRYLGVVPQDGQVAADSIWNNVAASSRLDTDEICEALRDAALEGDVRTMPMGLQTICTKAGAGCREGSGSGC